MRQNLIASLCHRYPLYSGCGSLANSWLVRRLAGVDKRVACARLHNGMRMLAPLDDYDGRAAFFVGDLDRKVTWICSRIVRPGDIVVDVGANLGLVTLTLSSLVGSDGRVFAFEPNRRLVDMLEQSIDLNDIRNVSLQNTAVGAENGDLVLNVYPEHSGRSTLIDTDRAGECERIKVSVSTLSSSIPETVQQIRLLKIDVEGYEPQVLRGARDLFRRSPPDAVLFELHHRGENLADHPSIGLLREYGYDFYGVPKRLVRMRLQRFDPYSQRSPGHDVLACRRGPISQAIGKSLGAL